MKMKYTQKEEADGHGRLKVFAIRLFPSEVMNLVKEIVIMREITLKQALVEACSLWIRAHEKRVPRFYQSGLIDRTFTGHKVVGRVEKKGKV